MIRNLLSRFCFCNNSGILTIGFLIVFSWAAQCQNQAFADSLEVVYSSGNFDVQEKLSILHNIAVNQTDTDKKLKFSNELIEIAQAADSSEYLLDGYLEKGNALTLKGELSDALESYLKVASIASENDLIGELGKVYIPIADVYAIMGNHKNAVTYYQQAVDILREEKDSINIASALLNAGDEFFNEEKLDTALILFEESSEIFEAINYGMGVAYNLGNIGLVYAKMGDNTKAEKNINQAIEILDKLGDYYPICVYLTYMSDIYLDKGEEAIAMNYALRSLELAKLHGLREQVSDANLKLSDLYENAGDHEVSLQYYKDYITYRDSIINIGTVQDLANLQTDYEVAQKQIEVDLLNEQKKNQQIIVIAVLIALFLIGLLAFGLYRRNKFVHETNRIIENEKNRSESLLLNILPEETAEELKENGRVQPKRYDSVTVLFTDFKGFTNYSEQLSPEELVESVDFYFSQFDQIMEKYNLEKIKTIGDAYMCAGGLPHPSDDHAAKIVEAAIEMAKVVEQAKNSKEHQHTRFDVRIGINSGPVVAGIVGTKKFAYDIWGDTVNIASRMESSSEPGKINISENTYGLVKDHFVCEFRGEIEAKNKGTMKMYFVKEPVISS